MENVFDLILTLSCLVLFWIPLLAFVIWITFFVGYTESRTKQLQEDFFNGLDENDRKVIIQYRKQTYWQYRRLMKRTREYADYYKKHHLDGK